MSTSDLGKALDTALDAATGPGTVHAEAGGTSAEVDVIDVDRLGVKCARVKVRRGAPLDVAEAAKELSERVRALGEPLSPVEVDPSLGGAVLRSPPEDGEFYELGAQASGDLELRRHKGGPGVDRAPADFTLTRKALGRLVDELG